jgi:hypothetical protein
MPVLYFIKYNLSRKKRKTHCSGFKVLGEKKKNCSKFYVKKKCSRFYVLRSKLKTTACHSGMHMAGIQGKLRFEYNRK